MRSKWPLVYTNDRYRYICKRIFGLKTPNLNVFFENFRIEIDLIVRVVFTDFFRCDNGGFLGETLRVQHVTGYALSDQKIERAQ